MPNDKKQDQDKNIIHFPELEKRMAREKTKKKDDKKAKKQEKLEEQYRHKYRMEQDAKKLAANAMNMSTKARKNASGKQPFINWDKIPMFTRIMLGTFLLIQLVSFFALDPAGKMNLYYHFGFVPAMYIGHVTWNWTALASPITSLLIHSGWMHLLFNCVMMTAMGVFFERQFGAKRTLIFFLLCGMGGHLFYMLVNPYSAMPVIGASGAISGLFAVTFLMLLESDMVAPQMKDKGPWPFILLWSFIIVGLGMLGEDISWQSHIGGFWSGIALFFLWRKGHIRL